MRSGIADAVFLSSRVAHVSESPPPELVALIGLCKRSNTLGNSQRVTDNSSVNPQEFYCLQSIDAIRVEGKHPYLNITERCLL